MKYLITVNGNVDQSFIDRTRNCVDTVLSRMGIEDIYTIELIFYEKAKDFMKNEISIETPVIPCLASLLAIPKLPEVPEHQTLPGQVRNFYRSKLPGPPILSEQSISELKSRSALRMYGIIGKISLSQEMEQNTGDKIFLGRIGHELGHLKFGVENGYKSFDEDSFEFKYAQAVFSPYFLEKRQLNYVVFNTVSIPLEYHAYKYPIDAGFIEESFSDILDTFKEAVEDQKKLSSNPRLVQLMEEARRDFPYLLLELYWHFIARSADFLGEATAFEKSDAPQELKQKLSNLCDEFEKGDFYGEYNQTVSNIRRDLLKNTQIYLDPLKVPHVLLNHFRDFTKAYAGIDHLPTIIEIEREIKRIKKNPETSTGFRIDFGEELKKMFQSRINFYESY